RKPSLRGYRRRPGLRQHLCEAGILLDGVRNRGHHGGVLQFAPARGFKQRQSKSPFDGQRDTEMNYARLSTDDLAVLDSDREFAARVLEFRSPTKRLTATAADLSLLQKILDGGPYTDSPEGELIALGTSLGDLLAQALNMKWVRYSDEYGSDLALRYEKTSIAIFPRDMIVKRVENGEDPDLQDLYDGV